MIRYITQAYHRLLGRDPASDLLDASAYAFAGGTASIEGFSDPSRLPATQAAALIDAVVASRPDAGQLREQLMARFSHETSVEPQAPSTRWRDQVATSKWPEGRGL